MRERSKREECAQKRMRASPERKGNSSTHPGLTREAVKVHTSRGEMQATGAWVGNKAALTHGRNAWAWARVRLKQFTSKN